MANKNVLMWVGLFTLSVVGTGGACYYQMGQLATTGKRVVALKKEIEEEGDVQTQLEEINAKLTDSKDKLDHLERGVPQRAYVPTMMTEIETIGKENGIIVTGVRPLPAKIVPPKLDADGKEIPDKKPYEEQDIEVKGTGKYFNVMQFLTAIETFPKICGVRVVTLQPKTDAENKQSTMLEITIEVRAYLFREDAKFGIEESLAKGGKTGEGI